MKTGLKVILPLLSLLVANYAKAEGDSIVSVFDSSAILLIVFMLAVVLFFIVSMIYASKFKGDEKDKSGEVLSQVLTGAVPLDREEEVMTDHNYDGIKELDNHLPPWWLWLFYGTLIFAVVYPAYYFSGLGLSQEEEYAKEMALAADQKEAIAEILANEFDESNVAFLDSEADLLEGKEIYTLNCQVCHMEDGGGGIGPNFTDEYWIHGGSMNDMYMTIKEGVLDKGMIAWKDKLTPFEMQKVASYIKTFQGTTPANPKEPQGTLYTEE